MVVIGGVGMGRVIPCDFIVIVKSQQPVYLRDALAYGKTAEQLPKENVPQHLIPHKSLATQVRKQLHASHTKGELVEGFNFSTTTLLTRYLEASSDVPADPPTLLPRI
ncbi:hypothetical protein DITRI_Ditri03aG0204300 [Diplodiscus trichospermus]